MALSNPFDERTDEDVLRDYGDRGPLHYRFRDRSDAEMDESSPTHQAEHREYQERVYNFFLNWAALQVDAPCPEMALWMTETFAEAARMTPLVIYQAMKEREQAQRSKTA